jgi:Fe-S-cluster containining protein
LAKSSSDKTLTLFVPEGFTGFKCTRCGGCCETPQRLEISPAKYERLIRLLSDNSFHYPVRDAVMRGEYDYDAPATFATVGEKCVFLSDGGHCHICDLGSPELRPLWCTTFPVTPITTPRGINYSISFACPETVKMLKAKEPLNVVALGVDGAGLPSIQRPYTARHRIGISAGRPKLDWGAHRLVEGMLLAVARDWKIKTADRLVLMPVMLEHLLRDYAGPGSDEVLRERVGHAGEEIGTLLAAAQACKGDPQAHYEAISAIFSRRIGLRSKSDLRHAVDAAMRKVREHRTQTTTAELGAALSRLYARYYKPRASRLDHILGNYIICRLFASPEMINGGVYKGVYVVCYLAALVRFFATTTAAEQDRAVNQTMMLDAVQTVEKVFGQSRTIFEFLDGDGEQHRMLDPTYAATLMRI